MLTTHVNAAATGPDDDMDLNAIITQACEDAAKVPEVVQALSMLEAVSTAYVLRSTQSSRSMQSSVRVCMALP